MTGPLRPSLATVTDLRGREMAALAPLVVLIVALGFYPKPLLDVIEPAVETTLTQVGVEDPEPTVAGSDTSTDTSDQSEETGE